MNIYRLDQDEMRYKTFLNIRNIELDYCNYSRSQSMGSILLELFAADLKTHGNLIQNCPVTGLVYLHQYKPDLSNVPFILPQGQYIANLVFLTKNATSKIRFGSMATYVTVKSI